MTQTNPQKRIFSEQALERALSLACYLSLPLILLFGLTITLSLVTTGGLNTNVNAADSFCAVFLSFSLPMMLALAAIPLWFKMGVQKRSAAQLGLTFPKSRLNLMACAVMAAGSAVLAVVLSGAEGLEVSAWTVWLHFFFVAVAEEIMLRSIIMDELRFFTRNKWVLCLLNGVIFAFVYHSSEDFWSNLLVRVPLGFVLSLVRVKSDNVYPAIMLHWLYNMFVTTI